MKIGILTYYGDLNCGTNLQAYATLCAVKKSFPHDNVNIIAFHGFTPPNVRPYLYHCTPISLWRDLKRIKGYKSFVQHFLGVINSPIIRNPQEALSYIDSFGYDRIYIGADTLLELDRLPKNYDGLSAYWLSPKVQAKQYLLSASAKNVSYKNLTHRQKEELISCIPNYNGISVRDMTTFRLIANFIAKEKILLTPDPTFTLEIEDYHAANYIKRRNLKLDNVICLHTLRDDQWASGFVKLAKEKGYQIASFRPARWADFELNDMTPFEQLGIYRFFKCMITHRFHDTVFCLKNNCPVISYPVSCAYIDDNGDSKYSTLLSHFDLCDLCLIDDRQSIVPEVLMEKVDNVISEFPNYKKKIIKVRNEISENYMKSIRKMN